MIEQKQYSLKCVNIKEFNAIWRKINSYLADSSTILSKMSFMKEFIVATAVEEIVASGWTWRRTMPMWVLYWWSFFFFLRPAPPAGRPRPFLTTSGTTGPETSPRGDSAWAVKAGLTALGEVEGLPALLPAFFETLGLAALEGILVLKMRKFDVCRLVSSKREWNSVKVWDQYLYQNARSDNFGALSWKICWAGPKLNRQCLVILVNWEKNIETDWVHLTRILCTQFYHV